MEQAPSGVGIVEQFGDGLHVLVATDPDAGAGPLHSALSRRGFLVHHVHALNEGTLPDGPPPDLVVLEPGLFDGDVVDLAHLLHVEPDLVVVVLFADGEVAADDASRIGADVVEPGQEEEGVEEAVRRATERLRLQRRIRALSGELVERTEHLESLRTELQEKSRELEAMVVRDPLSGLYNHAYFHKRLDRELIRCRRYGHSLSVAVFDIDRFREINDSFGHPLGDRVVRAMAQLLAPGLLAEPAGLVRAVDVAARYGGDELVLILPETPKEGALVQAERLRKAAESTGGHDGLPRFTCSVGVATYPDDADTREGMVEAAEVAVSAAKRRGRNCVVPYSSALAPIHSTRPTHAEAQRTELARAVDRSIVDGAFSAVFQPVVRAGTREVYGYEALCRPRHEMLGQVELLFEVAVDLGRVVELGRAVREPILAALPDLPRDSVLFINVHPQELNDPQLLDSGFDAHAARMVVEVTESAAIKDTGYARVALARLRERGFRIALDDLGSGYASLNSLATLEPEFVKLDMEMLRGIRTDSRNARLIKHIIEFCQGEDITVIAEGIQTQQEAEVVSALGCPLLQGFLVGRPDMAFR